MSFATRILNAADAVAIASWIYESPYDFYNMGGTAESVNELLNGAYRTVESDGQTIGFYCLGASAQVPTDHKVDVYNNQNFLDLGIGMHPDLTGKGLGRKFVDHILRDVTEMAHSAEIRLTVAAFNQRAIRLYERFGFQPDAEFERNGVVFQTMIRPMSSVHDHPDDLNMF